MPSSLYVTTTRAAARSASDSLRRIADERTAGTGSRGSGARPATDAPITSATTAPPSPPWPT